MITAIISDVHGNYPALIAALEMIDAEGINDIVCLGDIAGYYSSINECCHEIRRRNIHCLMGNHDWYLVTDTPCPRSQSANDCLEYQKKVIHEDNLAWLTSLKPLGEYNGISIVHAGWNDPLDEYVIPPFADYFSGIPGTLFSSGHTHVPCVWRGEGKQYCNPGSIGQPRDGNPDASFAIWDGETFHIKRVPYDIDQTSRSMHAAGFNNYYYSNLKSGTRIGGKIDCVAP